MELGRSCAFEPSREHERAPRFPAGPLRPRPRRTGWGLRRACVRPSADPPRRAGGLVRSAYCFRAGPLRPFKSGPPAALLRDRRPDPRRGRASQVDLVELLGLPQARARAQGVRLLQVDHVPLSATCAASEVTRSSSALPTGGSLQSDLAGGDAAWRRRWETRSRVRRSAIRTGDTEGTTLSPAAEPVISSEAAEAMTLLEPAAAPTSVRRAGKRQASRGRGRRGRGRRRLRSRSQRFRARARR
jgi:hypothetical protein